LHDAPAEATRPKLPSQPLDLVAARPSCHPPVPHDPTYSRSIDTRLKHRRPALYPSPAMLARGTLGRCAVATTSARDIPQLASFLHRILVTRKASGLPAALAVGRAYRSALEARRCYATTTTATKPTATVKKAVKAQAASKAPPKKTAAASTKTKTAKKTAKKPAPKKTTKAKPKTKAKKAAPKKPAPKKRVKKVLTDEQKAAARILELRKIALREPVTPGAVTAFNTYIADKFKSATSGDSKSKLTALSKAFKDLTPSEREVSR
jgi:outer membrane biosynthesis protein TonB